MHTIRGVLLLAALLCGSRFAGAAVVTNWAVFNDHVPGATHANANRYNLRGVAGSPPEPVSGVLKDFATGLDTPAYVISTAVGAPDYFGSMAAPALGTPAYNLFNGIVDVGNVNSGIGVRFSSSGFTSATLTFSNLNPSQRYIFRGTAVRGGLGGTYPRRWSLVSLRGVDSFTNAHSAAIYTKENFASSAMTNGQAAWNAGMNVTEGALVGWDEIAPGADGKFTITTEQYVDNPLPNGQAPDLATYGYGLCAIYLAEVGEPTPVVFTSQPATNVVLEQNRPLRLSALAQGAPSPVYQWYKDNVALSGANSSVFSIAAAQPSDSGDYYLVATNSLNQATSSVAHVVVYADTNGPVLLKIGSDESFARINLVWDEPVLETSAIEVGNYRIFDMASNEVTVSSAVWNGSNVVLNVPALAPDSDYWVEIDFQTDNLGNMTAPSGTPEVDANGITRTVHTWVYTPGLTRFQAYLGATSIPAATGSPLYPNSGTFGFLTNVLYWPQTAPNIDNYVMRFDGLFVATESGLHKFNPAHDDEFELRVYPGTTTNGVPTVFTGACCDDLVGGGTLDVTLTAGEKYYYELLVHEAGGGDYAGIAVTLPSAAVVSPVAGQYLAVATDPTLAPNAGISLQPQSISIEENHSATFQVTATNTGGSVSYQWQVNSGGGFANIPGASSVLYTTPPRTVANNGDQYRAIVYVPGRTMISSAATLTVVADTHAPHVLRVTTGRLLTNIVVAFDEVMDPNSTAEPSNYELRDAGSNVVTLNSPLMGANNSSVSFTTVPLTLGATYTLHVQDISDAAGNPIASVDVSFQAGRGLLKYEVYATGAGNAVADLRAYAGYPNSPRETGLLESFDSDPYWGILVNTDPSREAYGARISGWFIPPVTTNYIFYNRSDDASELLLSTDNTAAYAMKIQEELACCNAFSSHASAPIALVAGNPYYIELLYKEGTGGDFGQVAVKQAGDPTSADALGPVSAAFLSAVDPTPPPARLNYTRNGDIVTLSWEAPYRLQVATKLAPVADWKDVDTGGATTYIADPAKEFDVFLDAAQSGGGGRTGTGSGTITVSGTNLLVDVTYSGLSGNRTDDHFHAPAVRGANAGVVYGLAQITTGNQAGTIKGTVPMTDGKYLGRTVAQQVQDMRNQLWYLNIHTSPNFGGGEIRGQVEQAKTRFYRAVKP